MSDNDSSDCVPVGGEQWLEEYAAMVRDDLDRSLSVLKTYVDSYRRLDAAGRLAGIETRAPAVSLLINGKRY